MFVFGAQTGGGCYKGGGVLEVGFRKIEMAKTQFASNGAKRDLNLVLHQGPLQ